MMCIGVYIMVYFLSTFSSHSCSLPGVARHVSRVSTSDSLGGLDVSVESGEEREQRPEASQGLRTAKVPLLSRAAREARVLVSASKRLVNRADASLAYFIDARQFEMSLAKLCIDLAVDPRSASTLAV